MSRVEKFIVHGSLLVCAIFSLIALYWMIFPIDPLEINEFIVKDEHVAPGQYLTLYFDYCKDVEAGGTSIRYFENDIVYSIGAAETKLPAGCHQREIRSIMVPEHIPPGIYRLKLVTTLHINPLNNPTYEVISNQFIIDEV